MPARELDRIGPLAQAYAALAGPVHLSSGNRGRGNRDDKAGPRSADAVQSGLSHGR